MSKHPYISYSIGFLLSLLLTGVAFGLVFLHESTQHQILSHGTIAAWAIALAIVQMLIQLFLFLHIGEEEKPRWNLSVLLFAILIVFIVICGTLWIMDNLEHGMDHVLYTGESATPGEEAY